MNGEHGYAVDVSGGTASDGQKIQPWSSPDNNTNTTKYVLPEAAGDGSYYLRWYKCEANGSFAATDFYIGGVTGNNQDVSCKKRENANRFHILQNADGSYLIRFADADYYGEPIYLSVSESKMADGTRASAPGSGRATTTRNTISPNLTARASPTAPRTTGSIRASTGRARPMPM